MKRVVSVVVILVALVVASSAVAAYQYAPPRQWTPGANAGSTYSSNWLANYFMTYGSGYDKTVTFIRNTNYGWNNTKRYVRLPRDVRAVRRNLQSALHLAFLLLGELQCPVVGAREGGSLSWAASFWRGLCRVPWSRRRSTTAASCAPRSIERH